MTPPPAAANLFRHGNGDWHMAPMALLMACALAASSGGGEDAPPLPPRRDLFGTRERKPAARAGAARVRGTIELSDGTREEGRLWLTADLSLVFFDTGAKKWREVALEEISRVDASPRAQELDREWRWKEGGSDEKVYTGRTRPRRWLDHEVSLKDGTSFTGRIKGTVIFIEIQAGPEAEKKGAGANNPRPVKKRYFIRQHQRGDWGDGLEDLLYIKSIVIREPKDPSAGEDARKAPAKRAAKDD